MRSRHSYSNPRLSLKSSSDSKVETILVRLMVCLEDLLYRYLMCILVCVKYHTRYVLLHITLLIACLCVLSVKEYIMFH